MKVRMYSTRAAAPDGVHVTFFKLGQVYDLPDSFAAAFISEGWAGLAEDQQPVAASAIPAEPNTSKRLYPPLRKGRR